MFHWLWKKFLIMFGRIKVSKYPMWLSYNPVTYKVKGEQYREAIKLLKPGYVLARGYDDYLDGYFIPGDYSHTAICVENNDEKASVIHSMSPGVFKQDLIDFLRCDRFVIFRPKKGLKKAVSIAKSLVGRTYDFDFRVGNNSYYCHEMVASCFPDLDIPTFKSYGKDAYITKSFVNSKDFEIIYEYNLKQSNY